MKIHSIERSNGPAFEGLFELIIADSGQGDTFRFDKPEDPGRYLLTFEIFEGADRKLVLIVALLEDWNVLYRDGQAFDSFDALRAYLEQLDPCAHLPPAAASDARVRRILSERYRDRRDRFLKHAVGRLGSGRSN